MDLVTLAARVALFPHGVAVELFSGAGVFARAWRQNRALRHIPIFELDWSHSAALDFTKPAQQRHFRGLMRSGHIRALHLGLDCKSWSRAREIPNFRNVRPLRSAEFPMGLPERTDKEQSQIDVGNSLAKFAVSLVRLARQLHVPISVENPEPSRLWLSPLFEPLLKLDDARPIVTDFCQDGTPWRKRVKFLCFNVDASGAARRCTGRGICSRSGCCHLELKGRVEGELLSRASQVYPFNFCRRLANAFANVFRNTSAHKVAHFFTGVAPE